MPDFLVNAVTKPTCLSSGLAWVQIHEPRFRRSGSPLIHLSFDSEQGPSGGGCWPDSLPAQCRVSRDDPHGAHPPWFSFLGSGELLVGQTALQSTHTPSSSFLLLPPGSLGLCLAVLEYFQPSNFVLLRV